jgi:hypothetical protein
VGCGKAPRVIWVSASNPSEELTVLTQDADVRRGVPGYGALRVGRLANATRAGADINQSVLPNAQSVWPLVGPSANIGALEVKYLDAVVLSVGDKDASITVYAQPMREPELSGPASRSTPR